MINIQRSSIQFSAAPHAMQATIGQHVERPLSRQAHIPGGLVPRHRSRNGCIIHSNILAGGVVLDETAPLGDEGRFNPCAKAPQRSPKMSRDQHVAELKQVCLVQCDVRRAKRHPPGFSNREHRPSIRIGNVCRGHPRNVVCGVFQRLVKGRGGFPRKPDANAQVEMRDVRKPSIGVLHEPEAPQADIRRVLRKICGQQRFEQPKPRESDHSKWHGDELVVVIAGTSCCTVCQPAERRRSASL